MGPVQWSAFLFASTSDSKIFQCLRQLSNFATCASAIFNVKMWLERQGSACSEAAFLITQEEDLF